ncbi:MAG TPA: ATP phosphoribosyltransferase regulatory subunit, partial [Myxococcota bacterium]|nr:ATP phosphoribosyltransferase regulatory subunit [Myxococcota bacterium]
MTARVEPRLLKGFRDFLPAEEAGRASMLARITRAFALCGFAPLSTPAIEYADVLLGKYGAEGEKLLYRFTDNGGRDVALRYDLTVPLARVAASAVVGVPPEIMGIGPAPAIRLLLARTGLALDDIA